MIRTSTRHPNPYGRGKSGHGGRGGRKDFLFEDLTKRKCPSSRQTRHWPRTNKIFEYSPKNISVSFINLITDIRRLSEPEREKEFVAVR